jgi:transcriptional regulator with XRE-family HTH domain
VARKQNVQRLAWTPNQIVAYNVARARLLRGWTQEQAADALAPYLGTRLSAASFSALERSVAGGRIREFSADELLALSRGFDLPIGWFLTPPTAMEGVALATPDHPKGADPMILLDAILGTDDNIEAWEQVLVQYPAPHWRRMRIHADGQMEDVGRVGVDVDFHERLEHVQRLRAKLTVREKFGDLAEARRVLQGIADVLDELDTPSGPGEVDRDPTARADTNRTETRK